MAFNETLPTNTTKIRDLGTEIRPNWVAIQTALSSFAPWAVNLVNRTTEVPGQVDPILITGPPSAYIMYSKQDGAGNAELYSQTPAGNTIQMTKGDATIAATGSTFLAGGLLMKWGTITLTTPTVNLVNFIAEGLLDFPNAIYNVQLTYGGLTGTSTNVLSVTTIAVDEFNVRGTSGLLVYWTAIGS
jgi:hypothetical protein